MNNTTQNKLADMFAKRFEEYNTEVLKKLAEIIKQFDGLTYSEASQLANQLKYDRSYIDLVDELSKLTGKSKKEIKKVLEETVKQHTEFADTFFKARNIKTPVYENDTYLKELVNSVANVSEGDFVNLAKSTGFAFLDKKNHIQFLNMKDTYYKVIDECVYAISESKATYGESIRKIIKQLSDSGVRRIVYANDNKKQYTQRIDTAVRRNVLDSIREVSIESQKEFGKRFDADGVEITVHENPAPDHMNVQGHQFSNEEFDKFQNDEDCEDVNGVKYPATSDETGRDRRSIGQYNCYHTVFSIIVGVSQPLYSNEELEKIKERANEKINIDGKEYTRYETTQLQRELETQIRYAKDRHIMYKEVNDKEGMLEEQLRITQLTRKYKEISNKAGIREQLNRASVSGYKRVSVKNLQEKQISNNEIIVYHSTPNKFNEFDEKYIKPNDPDFAFNGFYFTEKKEGESPYFNSNYVIKAKIDISNLAGPEDIKSVLKEINNKYNIYDDTQIPKRSRSWEDEVRYTLQDKGFDGIQTRGVNYEEAKEVLSNKKVYNYKTPLGNDRKLEKVEGGYNYYENGEFNYKYKTLEEWKETNPNEWVIFNKKKIKILNIKNLEEKITKPKDIAIHFGDLGKARDTNYFSISSGRRSTGHFGDGTYFVSKEEANRLNNSTYFSRKDRPQKEVDFSQYNLYKPLIEPEGMRLHEGLKAINYGEYDDYNFRFMKDDLIRNGISEDNINKAIKIVEEKRKEFEKGDFEYQLKQDSLSTIFMKELGYNGIDVRGLENLDNMSYGSVIYDLKKKKNRK